MSDNKNNETRKERYSGIGRSSMMIKLAAGLAGLVVLAFILNFVFGESPDDETQIAGISESSETSMIQKNDSSELEESISEAQLETASEDSSTEKTEVVNKKKEKHDKKQKEKEKQEQEEKEIEKQKEKEKQEQEEKEIEKQKELEKQEQEEKEIEKQKELEEQKKKDLEKEKELAKKEEEKETKKEPIGTSQTGDHFTNYDDGSQDRIEIKEAVSRATGVSGDDMVENWVGNDGDQKVTSTITQSSTGKKFKVSLQWIDNKGWKVNQVEEL